VTSPAPSPMRGRRRGTGPQPYDFRRPNSLSREHVRALQIASETFARQASTVLTTTLRTVSTVTPLSTEQLSYGEYVRSVPDPSFLALHTVAPLAGTGILALPLATAMRWVDRLLGGQGTGPQPTRAFTEIETLLLLSTAQRVLRELTYAFEAVVRLSPEVTSLQVNPQFAQVAAPSDVVVVTGYEMRIGDEDCLASLCLPLAPLLPHLEASAARGRPDRAGDGGAAAAVARRLEEVPVDVRVRFTPVQVSSSTVLRLTVGDVLPLRHPVTEPLAVTAADVTCARAVPGVQGKRLACLVVDPGGPR